jgi:hypothetical protein
MNDAFRFSILTLPQRISGGTLSFNILIVPQIGAQWSGNPLLKLPLGAGQTPFAEAAFLFEARVISDPGQFPADTPFDHCIDLTMDPASTPDAAAIYSAIRANFEEEGVTIKEGDVSSETAEAPKPQLFIKKYLPQSYRGAFHFTRPRVPEAVTDDSYQCAVRDAKKNDNFVPSPPEITWGKVYAYCLRHPLLARRLGLIRSGSIPIEEKTFAKGGYLYVTLRSGSEYLSGGVNDEQFSFIRHYAARIPALKQAADRPLFAANLFPVLVAPAVAEGFDQVFIDTADYDDGFCKIVHTRQPVSQNLLVEEADGFPPVYDLGIQQSWDDEKVLEWLNGQLKGRVDKPGERLDAPLGVFAYRVDAKKTAENSWHSLVHVKSKAPLQLGAVNLGDFNGELGIEVYPMQLDGDQANGQFWLPSYFTSWDGHSLVLPDADAAAIYHTVNNDGKKATLGRLYDAVGLKNIPLRYGEEYEFRVRMMDVTGGGPRVTDEPVHSGEAWKSKRRFKRYIKPEPLRVDKIPTMPITDPNPYFAGDTLTVRRPLLGYPAVVYTGKYADPVPLLVDAANAAAGSDSFGLADPDVVRVRIDVEIRTLLMDNKLSMSGSEAFIHLYQVTRDFPAGFDDPLQIPLDFIDAHVLNFGDTADLGDLRVTENELANMQKLVLPRGRDIRLTMRAEGNGDTSYYDANDAWLGKPIQLLLRREPLKEIKLLAELSKSRTIRGIYLQPDPPRKLEELDFVNILIGKGAAQTPAIIQRLAEQLDVEHKGLTLVGEKGQRLIFGCSRRIRHTLSPDNSAITFASKDELLNQWIVALTFQVDRDWTWDNVQEISFELFRKRWFSREDEPADFGENAVGLLEMKRTAPMNALQTPDRSKTTLIYLDAIDPKPVPDAADLLSVFPDTIELRYELRPNFRTAPGEVEQPQAIDLKLPVTTPPEQVPRLASAGLALSPYVSSDDYSFTEPRERYLWLEFEEPVLDPNDRYFIRLLGYGPDPLLMDNRPESFVADEKPPINLDPELARVITPGQGDDRSGLAAMQPLEPATFSDRHFLVPLPPGLNPQSDELFGFFTYELRVGHRDIWSTAQGRYGRPLQTTGVQHPSPTLFCTAFRDVSRLVVEAPHAVAVLKGRNITADPPRTDMWALLYVQVRQADGKENRNLLLDERQLALQPRDAAGSVTLGGSISGVGGDQGLEDAPRTSAAVWSDDEVKNLLAGFGLPPDASLSVICVELMPHVLNLLVPGRGGHLAALRRSAPSNPLYTVGAAMTANMGGLAMMDRPVAQFNLRPLSDQLGHFRILRTSPLTAVPDSC